MNRQTIREEILETWLAETNSDFYTDAAINNACDHEYRKFCAETGAGPAAEFEFADANGTKRSWDLPTELVDAWRVDYDTTRDEIPFLPFQRFSAAFGDGWIGETGTGLPYAYALLGSHGIIFHQIPANTIKWRVYGPIVPDKPASDTTTLLVLEADGYVISARAYIWMVERNLSRLGSAPPNYERAIAEARRGTEEAKGRIRRLHGGVRLAGSVTPGVSTGWDRVRRYGPFVKFPAS